MSWSIKAAERVTGWEIEELPDQISERTGRRLYVYLAMDLEHGFIKAKGEGLKPEYALDDLVKSNYVLRSQEAFELAGWRCSNCGRAGVGLEIDHIKMRSHGRDDRISNMRVLCSDCHRLRHSAKGRAL